MGFGLCYSCIPPFFLNIPTFTVELGFKTRMRGLSRAIIYRVASGGHSGSAGCSVL